MMKPLSYFQLLLFALLVNNLLANTLPAKIEAQLLSAPSSFSLESATTHGVQISWMDSFEDESSYALYLSTNPERPASPHTTFPANSTTGTLTGLIPGQHYYLWLEAINPVGHGAAAELDYYTLTKELPESIAVGAGSYAAYPPYDEGNDPGRFQNYATNTKFNTVIGETRPIPTNDWWTHLLFNETDSALWIYPQMLQTINEGFRLFFPRTFNESGTNIELGAFVMITGENFTPTETIAKDWSDWGLVATRKTHTQRIDASIAHGIPMTYFETEGLDVTLRFGGAARFFDRSKNELSFPNNEAVILVVMDGAYYGLHLPANTTVTKDGNNLTINSDFFTISVLPNAEALDAFHAHAFNIPRKTEVYWSFDAENSTLRNTWSIVTENLTGAAAGPVLQGFLPHHFNDLISQDFALSDYSYVTTRGDLTLASGNSFSMEYRWCGILPHYPSPDAVTGDTSWQPEVMNAIIDDYASNAKYGSDTYWGGKDIIQIAKYMLFARDLEHEAYPTIKALLKEALVDWLTYTPGERERYYAHYPAWGGLVGFNESYYSYQFTDHHFHYGYLIHAAALMAMVEPEWVESYAPMLKRIAKEYANWERADSDFPFLRNFDPWMGHSYAGGVGSPGGNNQESTSEAVQSWAALFYLGAILGDDAMRDAGAFGYQAESNATMEYWFNRSGTNWNQAYADTQDVIGVLWNGGYVYGTFFSAAPQHIYGIQWLPVIPAFKHLAKGVSPQWSDALYQELLDRILVDLKNNEDPAAADGVISEVDVGTDWSNVLLGFRLFTHPTEVTAKLEKWKDSSNAEERDVLFSPEGGLTYYYAHAHASWGDIDWEVQFSMPMATAFTHPETGKSTYVIFNEAREERLCEIRRNGKSIASVRVPAMTTIAYHP